MTDAAGTAVHCHVCGAANRGDAKFCRQCGAGLGDPPVQKAVDPGVTPLGPLPPTPSAAKDKPSARRIWPAAAALAAVLVLACAAIAFFIHPFGWFTPKFTGFAAQDVGVVASMDAHPHVIGQLRRGEPISGHWSDSRAGHARWLKVNWPGAGPGYIWGHALSPDPRPQMETAVNGPGVAKKGTQVFSRPDASAPVIDNLSPGEGIAVVGMVAGGWAEVALPIGGVGYVPSTILDGDVDDQSKLAGVTHYVCSLSPQDSVNPSPDTPQLSFVLDANRSCVDHRYPYARTESGELRRVVFDASKRRASLLVLSADHQTFQRSDFDLDEKNYRKVSRNATELTALECPVPADTTAAEKSSKTLTKLFPELGPQTPATSSSRRIWRCFAP